MKEAIRKTLMPGVFLTYVETSKFKTCYMGLHMLRPLDKNTAAVNAVIPNVLRRGTVKYPDMESISKALDELYGTRIETAVRKKGEVQSVGFVADFIDEKYTPGNEPLFTKTAAFLGELLTNPVLESGSFKAEYADGEKENLITEIEAQINDKRQYAQTRLIQLMCADEAYGTDKLGGKEEAAAIGKDSAYSAYRDILASSRIEIFFCGSISLERVCEVFSSVLSGLPRTAASAAIGTLLVPRTGSVKTVTESMEVTQGKLAMGFRTGLDLHDPGFPAMLILNTAFGGSTTAKLFMNVREAMSLCYYASSSFEKHKGLIIVSSGVEFENLERTRDEILNQMKLCREGKLEDWELSGAVSYMMTMLKTTEDSPGRLEDFYLGQAIANLFYSPSGLAGLIKDVTLEQVIAAAKRTELDTVYFLKN